MEKEYNNYEDIFKEDQGYNDFETLFNSNQDEDVTINKEQVMKEDKSAVYIIDFKRFDKVAFCSLVYGDMKIIDITIRDNPNSDKPYIFLPARQSYDGVNYKIINFARNKDEATGEYNQMSWHEVKIRHVLYHLYNSSNEGQIIDVEPVDLKNSKMFNNAKVVGHRMNSKGKVFYNFKYNNMFISGVTKEESSNYKFIGLPYKQVLSEIYGEKEFVNLVVLSNNLQQEFFKAIKKYNREHSLLVNSKGFIESSDNVTVSAIEGGEV